MAGSGMICVFKRDGSTEPFDRHKLRGCLLRVLPAGQDAMELAGLLALAVRRYLLCRRLRCVGSAAVLEMALTALRAVGRSGAAAALERGHALRLARRSRLSLLHGRGVRTAWSKAWLVEQARRRWGVGRTVGRILAGQVESRLLRCGARRVRRATVLACLGRLAGAYGLAAPARVGSPQPA